MSQFRLGTRGSPLALYQAHAVASAIAAASGHVCEIVVIRTSGDRLAEAPLSEIGGKRLFVKEIEDALIDGTIDLAVHSSKDMSALLPEGLTVAATLPREDARDALVLRGDSTGLTMDEAIGRLGRTPRIGTSSVRRQAQLIPVFTEGSFLPIRGNLDTRLRKLDAGDFDAIVLASAGLRRLQHQARISAAIPVHTCVPAPGQGIIAIEMRAESTVLGETLAAIDDRDSHAALEAERTVVSALGGGCQMPIGAHAVIDGESMVLTAVVTSLDGARLVRSDMRGVCAEARLIGTRVAAELLANGAREILAEVGHTHGMAGGQHA